MANQDDSLIREVNEELQRERLAKLWQQYNGVILGVAAAIIIGVGGFKFYEQRRQAAAEAAGARYAMAVRDLALPAKAADAEKTLEALAKDGSGFATLARFRKAAADATAGRPAEAIAAYESLGREKSLDPALANFAKLQTAMLKLDTSDWTEMQNRLNALTAESNVWRHNARELLGLAAIKANRPDLAREQFEKLIVDTATPPSIAERTRVMMGILTAVDLAKTATPPASAAPVAPDAATVKK